MLPSEKIGPLFATMWAVAACGGEKTTEEPPPSVQGTCAICDPPAACEAKLQQDSEKAAVAGCKSELNDWLSCIAKYAKCPGGDLVMPHDCVAAEIALTSCTTHLAECVTIVSLTSCMLECEPLHANCEQSDAGVSCQCDGLGATKTFDLASCQELELDAVPCYPP